MKLIITESQLSRLPLTEGLEDSSLFKIYKKTYTEAKGKLNGLYLKITSYSVMDILTRDNQINDIENLAYGYNDKVYKMANILESKIDEIPEEVYNRDYEKYEGFRDIIRNYSNVIEVKHDVIYNIANSLQGLYSKVIEDNHDGEVDLNKVFTDIKTIDV